MCRRPRSRCVVGPQPDLASLMSPVPAGSQVQRLELVHTQDPPIGGWMAVEVGDSAHLRHEVGVVDADPRDVARQR